MEFYLVASKGVATVYILYVYYTADRWHIQRIFKSTSILIVQTSEKVINSKKKLAEKKAKRKCCSVEPLLTVSIETLYFKGLN